MLKMKGKGKKGFWRKLDVTRNDDGLAVLKCADCDAFFRPPRGLGCKRGQSLHALQAQGLLKVAIASRKTISICLGACCHEGGLAACRPVRLHGSWPAGLHGSWPAGLHDSWQLDFLPPCMEGSACEATRGFVLMMARCSYW